MKIEEKNRKRDVIDGKVSKVQIEKEGKVNLSILFDGAVFESLGELFICAWVYVKSNGRA